MKIIILHGDHVSASYARLSKFIDVAKERGWQVIFLDDAENIKEKLSNVSLFGEENFYVIRNLAKLGKDFFKKNAKRLEQTPGNLVIYNEEFISRDLFSSVPKEAKIEEFKLPSSIFHFLESFYPGNSQKALLLLRGVLKNEPVEFVFALLAKHLRDLYWMKSGNHMPYPSWRVQKLKNQAAKFEKQTLENTLKSLAEEDIKVKTSQAELTSSLDLIALTLLE